MQLKTLATHTVDIERLTPFGGIVIDAGCRDFDFAEEMAVRGFTVHCFDPAPDVDYMGARTNIIFHKWALVGVGKEGDLKMVVAGNGSRLSPQAEFPVYAHSLSTLKIIRQIACVKLDVEGSEYDILLTWPGPIADQVTVEFHEHTNLGKAVHGDDIYKRINAHMSQWYDRVQDSLMDTLWVLR